MKKLMTMIAAVATAFGLFADTVADTGTSFEAKSGSGMTGGALADVLDNLVELKTTSTPANYWDLSGITGDATATVTAYVGGKYTGSRPQQYGSEGAQNYFLALKTGSAELTRYALEKDASKVSPYAISNGTLYFDSLVKLTAFDEEITPDGKLAVWLYENETAGETNLMVSVDGGTAINCGDGSAYLDAWVRLTIKAMEVKANTLGFVVFVDTAPVTGEVVTDTTLTPVAQSYAQKGQLFVCTGDATIESVGFKGQGSVDDLVFTQTVPGTWAADPQVAQIVLDKDLTPGLVVEISTNGVAITQFPALVEKGVTVVAKADGTHMDKTYENVQGTLTIKDEDFADAAATVTIGATTTKFAALTGTGSAVETVNGATEAATLKLIDNADAAMVFANAAAPITVDLNGLTAQAISVNLARTALIIDDTSIGAAGKVDGAVTKDAGFVSITANAGKFLVSANPTMAAVTPKSGFKFVQNSGYWELAAVYAITTAVEPEESGTVTVDPTSAAAGETVAVMATPADGYKLVKIMAGALDITDVKTFTMPDEAVTVTATFEQEITDHSVTITWEGGEFGSPITAVKYQVLPAGELIPVESGVAFRVNDGETIKVVVTHADWHKISGDGEYTITADTDDIAITATAIDPSAPATPAEAGITSGAFANASKTDVGKVAGWAANNHVSVETVNAMTFDGDGDPETQAATAFLLGCANSPDAIEAAAKQFKFDAIVPGVVPTPATPEGANGVPVQLGADEVTGPWDAAKAANKFFKSVLRFVPESDPVE